MFVLESGHLCHYDSQQSNMLTMTITFNGCKVPWVGSKLLSKAHIQQIIMQQMYRKYCMISYKNFYTHFVSPYRWPVKCFKCMHRAIYIYIIIFPSSQETWLGLDKREVVKLGEKYINVWFKVTTEMVLLELCDTKKKQFCFPKRPGQKSPGWTLSFLGFLDRLKRSNAFWGNWVSLKAHVSWT